jgi:uncharacterized protein YndB with AHSA1/START domain
MSRKIEKEVTIAATPEEVWRALTDGEMINRWYAPEARVQPGVGGNIFISWGPGFEGETAIEIWEPNRRLSTRNPKRPIAVDYVLEGKGGTTTLRLVQTMGDGPEWDDEFDGTNLGWTIFLGTLKDYFERHRGATCRQSFVFLPVAGDALVAWANVVGARGFGIGGAESGRVTANMASGDSLDADVLLRRHERPLGLVFEERNLDARVYVTLERGGGHSFLWLGVFAYASPTPKVDPAELCGRWKPMLEAALAG